MTGALDQVCAAIGAGNVAPGMITESTGSVLVLASRAEVEGAADGPLIVEAVLPNPLSLWMEMGTAPTLVEMVNAFEEDSPWAARDG